MEIFVDFGAFEMIAAAATAFAARAIYKSRAATYVLQIATIAAPVALLLLVPTEGLRWVAGVALATAVLNSVIIYSIRRATGKRDELGSPWNDARVKTARSA